MKKLFFIIGMLCACFSGMAQAYIQLTGRVSDPNNKSIEMANVIAINTSTNLLDSYCVTNGNGLYKLKLKSGTKYKIKFTFVGFGASEFTIVTENQDLKKDVVLSEETSLLNEIDVTYTMPVMVKGDTIVYDTDSFTTGTEKKLKDVLVSLPGVELNDDGQIEVEGKQVQKVMVEGKEFFDGDSKIASENIPADAVSKIEVLRNYNEIGQMKGLSNDEDNIALNIRLKKGKDRFWFGELTAGGGPDEKYLAHPKLFYYSPKYSLNLITDMNNIGEVPFNRRDFMNFTGGFKSFNPEGGSSIDVGSNSLGISVAQNNRAKELETRFAALNYNYEIKKGWDIGGFGIYSYNRTVMETLKNTVYQLDDISSKSETSTTQNHQKVDLGLFKFNTEYKPNSNFQFNYDVFLKQSNDNEEEDVISVVDAESNEIYQLKKQKPLSLKQSMNIYYTLNDKNIFALEAQHLYQNEDPFYNSITENFAFADLFPVDQNVSLYNLNQNKEILTNKLDAKLDYYLITGDKSNLQFSLGTTQNHQNYDTDIFQKLDDDSPLSMTDAQFTNDVVFNVSDLFFGFHYKLKAGIFTFNPGVTLHDFETRSTQNEINYKDQFYSVLPDIYINMQLKKAENLRLNYRISRSFTDVGKYAEALILKDYNSVYSGNPELESALKHVVSLNFFSFNMFNFTHMFANISYSKSIKGFKNNVIPLGIYQISSSVNSDLSDQSLSANARYQRTFSNFKVSGRLKLSWSESNNLVNSETSKSESFNQMYRTSVGTNFKNAPNLELGYKYSIDRYDRGSNTSTYYTKSPYAELDAKFLKNFILTANYDFYSYTDKEKTIKNQYGFLDADLTYQKEGSKWEFGIKGKNLLDTKSLDKNSENDYSFTSSTYFVQPRYLLFTIKYDI